MTFNGRFQAEGARSIPIKVSKGAGTRVQPVRRPAGRFADADRIHSRPWTRTRDGCYVPRRLGISRVIARPKGAVAKGRPTMGLLLVLCLSGKARMLGSWNECRNPGLSTVRRGMPACRMRGNASPGMGAHSGRVC
jgi:hypothetical protein